MAAAKACDECGDSDPGWWYHRVPAAPPAGDRFVCQPCHRRSLGDPDPEAEEE